MFDRVSMLLAAGVVTAGVSAAMLAGATVAVAATEPGGGSETSTSESSSQGDGQNESDNAGPADNDETETADQGSSESPDLEETDTDSGDGVDVEDDVDAQDDVDIEDTGSDDVDTDDADADESGLGASGDGEDAKESPAVASTEPAEETVVDAEPAVGPVALPEQRAESGGASDAVAVTEPTEQPAAVKEPTSAVARLTLVPAADAPTAEASAPRQTLLSIIGTVIFNLYSFTIRVFGGPPLLPWGSTVTVKSSSVEIDCGEGYEVPADWYVPEGPTPTRLIYLQHGFLAAGPFYSYTASRLAEATHSIVVTTSLTSNFLSCDGCWVGGSPMHKAVASLFADGSTALADSAIAAGYSSTLLDGVAKVVLMGHSAGGGLAAGAAGYMADNGTIDRLAGVVMLDGVGFAQLMPQALAKLPDNLPIYNLAGKAYYWNMNGAAGAALEAERPGQFNGVRLIGGLHSDTMLGGNPLVQAGLNLVTGWSRVENVKAAEALSAAWANDMFAGTAPVQAPGTVMPFYGPQGSTLTIETSRGTATAYVMPGPPEKLTLIDKLFEFFSGIIFGINFATCAAPEAASPAVLAGGLMENARFSAPNTLLSLDGTAKPRQSIAQHVCIG